MQSKKKKHQKINNHLSIKYSEDEKQGLLFVCLFRMLRKKLDYTVSNNN